MRWRGPTWNADVNRQELCAVWPALMPTLRQPVCRGCGERVHPTDQALCIPLAISNQGHVPEWFHLLCLLGHLGAVVRTQQLDTSEPSMVVQLELRGVRQPVHERRKLEALRDRLLLPKIAAEPAPDSEPGWPGRCEKCGQPNSYDTGLDGASIWCSNPSCPEAPPEGWEPN